MIPELWEMDYRLIVESSDFKVMGRVLEKGLHVGRFLDFSLFFRPPFLPSFLFSFFLLI